MAKKTKKDQGVNNPKNGFLHAERSSHYQHATAAQIRELFAVELYDHWRSTVEELSDKAQKEVREFFRNLGRLRQARFPHAHIGSNYFGHVTYVVVSRKDDDGESTLSLEIYDEDWNLKKMSNGCA